MNNKKKCFVIMPVSGTKSCTEDEWTGIYECMIKPAVTGSRLGFDCERAKPLTGAFIRDILEGLNRADVVIADLTDRNPNVCYELGIRHTLKKRTILTAQDIEDVPSDLRSYWVITYEKDLTGADKFKQRVREILREMQKDPEKPDSPVADFLERKNIDIVDFERSANLRKLSALISEISENIENADVLLKQVNKAQKRRKEGHVGRLGTPVRFSNSCLQLLVSTQYVLLPGKLPNYVRLANEQILLINSNLDLRLEFGEHVDDLLVSQLPKTKEHFTNLLQTVNQIRLDYANNNYQEPETPAIILASSEHEKYLKLIEQAK